MRSMTIALSVTLAVLLAFVLYVSGRHEEKPASSQPGEPLPDLDLSLDDPQERRPQKSARLIDDRQERAAVVSGVQPPDPEEEGERRIDPRRQIQPSVGVLGVDRESLIAELRVLHNFEPVEEAHVAVRHVQRGPHGGRTDPLAFEAACRYPAQATDVDGLITTTTSYPVLDADARFDIVAFHPDLQVFFIHRIVDLGVGTRP